MSRELMDVLELIATRVYMEELMIGMEPAKTCDKPTDELTAKDVEEIYTKHAPIIAKLRKKDKEFDALFERFQRLMRGGSTQ